MLAARATIELQHELLARLQQARAETDRLFDHVRPEFLYERPIPERHRIVFYVGHLEAFDWNLLRERILGRTSFHSEFDNLFAFGIDPVDGGLPTDRPSDWPVLVQVCDLPLAEIGIRVHRAELEHPERAIPFTHSPLPEEDRPA